MSGAPQPGRTAAGWFLGLAGIALFVLLWLRGVGRLLVPVLLAVLAGYAVVRVVRVILRPVE